MPNFWNDGNTDYNQDQNNNDIGSFIQSINGRASQNLASTVGKGFNFGKLGVSGNSTKLNPFNKLMGGLTTSAEQGLGLEPGGNLFKGIGGMVKDNLSMNNVVKNGAASLKGFIGSKGFADAGMNALGVGLNAVGVKPMDDITASGFDKGLDFVSKIPGLGWAGVGLKGLNLINKNFGGTSHTQGSDASLATTGYEKDFNLMAGKKYSLTNRSGRKAANRMTSSYDTGNVLKSIGGYNENINTMAAQNTSRVLADRNYEQINGGYGMHMISAKKGAKINPAKLRNLTKDVDFKKLKKQADRSRFTNSEKPSTYEEYYRTVPKNKRDTSTYNLERAFQLAPWEDLNAFRMNDDAHLNSVYKNDAGEYEFLKSNKHESHQKEIEWYNSKDPEAEQFRLDYDIDASNEYYKYIPRHAVGGKLSANDKEEIVEELVEDKMNVIPEGAFHSRKNNMPDHIAKHVTPKGIPVVTEDGKESFKQHAEVERNEIIFHKEATDTIETLLEKYLKADKQKDKDKIAIECGKFISNEILVNTDDRTGIIEKIN